MKQAKTTNAVETTNATKTARMYDMVNRIFGVTVDPDNLTISSVIDSLPDDVGNAILRLSKAIALSACNTMLRKRARASNGQPDSANVLDVLKLKAAIRNGQDIGQDVVQCACLSLTQSYNNYEMFDVAIKQCYSSVHKFYYNEKKNKGNLKSKFITLYSLDDAENPAIIRLSVEEASIGIDNTIDVLAWRQAIRPLLTPRQIAIVLYLVKGMKQADIARRLDVSQPMVAKHIKQIRRILTPDVIRQAFK